MTEEHSLAVGLTVAIVTSLLVWSMLIWRTRKLKVRVLDHTSFYSFMIAIDVIMAVKGPRISWLSSGVTWPGDQGTHVFIMLMVLTLVAGFVGVWLDARAEQALETARAAGHMQDQRSRWFGNLEWQAWRAAHRSLLLVMSTLQCGFLSLVSALGAG